MMKKPNNYVLITPARNEEAYIEKTIRSVIEQSLLPQKWVIVNDASIDGTDEIIKRFQKNYHFIQLLHRHRGGNRDFGSKVYAIWAGVEALRDTKYDFIGNLDADVSFESTYYARVLEKFRENPKLGIAGGIVFEPCNSKWNAQYINPSSVAGAIQMFRRECYEEIGGYIPLQRGGIDGAAEIMARMKGWETKSFPEIKVFHHRQRGTEGQSSYSVRYQQGQIEYLLGYHFLFEIAKCIYRIVERPYFLGSLFRFCGYFRLWLKREGRTVSSDFVNYLRQEQIGKFFMRNIIKD